MSLLAAHQLLFHSEFVGRPLSDKRICLRLLTEVVAEPHARTLALTRLRIAFQLQSREDALTWCVKQIRQHPLGWCKPDGFIKLAMFVQSHFVFTLFNGVEVKCTVWDAVDLLVGHVKPLAKPLPVLLATVREQRRRLADFQDRRWSTYTTALRYQRETREIIQLVALAMEKFHAEGKAGSRQAVIGPVRPLARRYVFSHPVEVAEVGRQRSRVETGFAYTRVAVAP